MILMHKRLFVVLTAFTLILSLSMQALADKMDYVLEDEERVPIPKAYEVTNVIYRLGNGAGFLNQAEDLFISKDNYLYVADTGNNRIVKLTLDGQFVREYTQAPEGKAFNAPSGVYVDEDGDLFIGDTNNQRIVHINSEGEFIEEFVKPESELLGAEFTFTPSKVYINPTGMIHLIRGQNFIRIDSSNNFRGFVGATELSFSLREMLVRMFATEEQKSKRARAVAESYSNFVIDDSGMIYATTLGKRNQIRKINSVGQNIYKKGIYGEPVMDPTTQKLTDPYFVDIAVDKDGIISVLEQKSGKIYQYDQEGNNLCVFGGLGTWKGTFSLPTSIAVDSEGRIYVLDRNLNNIQVFTPTKFINTVKKAVTLYKDGLYEETKELWETVISIDANYSLAHKGIGKVLIKEEKFKQAMEEYRQVEDKEGYSQAFGEYRHDMFRDNFTWVVLTTAVIIALIIIIFKALKKRADKAWGGGLGREFD